MTVAELVNPLQTARKVRTGADGVRRALAVLVRLPSGEVVPAAGWALTGEGLVIDVKGEAS